MLILDWSRADGLCAQSHMPDSAMPAFLQSAHAAEAVFAAHAKDAASVAPDRARAIVGAALRARDLNRPVVYAGLESPFGGYQHQRSELSIAAPRTGERHAQRPQRHVSRRGYNPALAEIRREVHRPGGGKPQDLSDKPSVRDALHSRLGESRVLPSRLALARWSDGNASWSRSESASAKATSPTRRARPPNSLRRRPSGWLNCTACRSRRLTSCRAVSQARWPPTDRASNGARCAALPRPGC